MRRFFNEMVQKGFVYWFVAGVLITIGIYIGHWVEKADIWTKARYQTYNALQKSTPRKAIPKRTVLVLIEDEEYWMGQLARRVPINRAYLANLLKALDKADPAVIALDFDLRSPSRDGSLIEHPNYQGETDELIKSIKELVSNNRKIVLPKTIGFNENQEYVLESDIFDKDFNFKGTNPKIGYISLPYDIRRIPIALKMKDGNKLQSFSMAIAEYDNAEAISSISKGDSLPYGTFIGESSFHKFSARKVLDGDPDVLSALRYKVVIVGAAWHEKPFDNRSKQTDTYITPVSSMGGAYIHANYVEAILDSRIYQPWGEEIATWIEIGIAIMVAIFFALNIGSLKKMLIVISLCLILVPFSYFLWQNLGAFFDFFIPTVLLGAHVAVEQIREWRAAALREHARDNQEGQAEGGPPVAQGQKLAVETRSAHDLYILNVARKPRRSFGLIKKQ